MLGTPAWDEALGTALCIASTLVSQTVLSQLVSPAHDERELHVMSSHTRSGACAALDTLQEDTIPVSGSAFT